MTMLMQGQAAPPVPGPGTPAVSGRTARAAGRGGVVSLRLGLLIGGLVLVIVGTGVGYAVYRDGARYVTTDNAQLTGQPIQIGSMTAGRIDAITTVIGSPVHKGDVVAQVAMPSQVGEAQNGQPRMGFLGAADTRVDVQALADGVVIAQPTAVGAIVQAGQTIVEIVDPAQLWVNANIDEANVERVKPGQPVTVHVDALNKDVPGKVKAITPATTSTFSLLPSNSSSGTFTKVAQLVPVRISVNLGNQPALLGSSVEVKIQVGQ